MGTNYYAKKILCEHCQNSEQLHIGKSSIGWKFLFRAYDEDSKASRLINSVDGWKEYLTPADIIIIDEYKKIIHPIIFWELVESCQSNPKASSRKNECDLLIDSKGYEFLPHSFS